MTDATRYAGLAARGYFQGSPPACPMGRGQNAGAVARMVRCSEDPEARNKRQGARGRRIVAAEAEDVGGVVARSGVTRWSSLWSRSRRYRRAATSIVVLLAAWEIAGRYVFTNRLFFVPISDIALAAVKLWQTGELQENIIASFSAVAAGMAIALVAGIVLGVWSGASRTFREYTSFIFTGLYSTPLVAMAPLLILWVGIGLGSKIAVVALMAVFPIMISTTSGILATDASFLDVARGFGATRLQTIRRVMIPAAIPFVLTGVRVAIGRSVVAVTVAELFGARAGLGFMIFTAGQTFDVPVLFVGVLTLAFAGVGLTLAATWLEERASRWRGKALEERLP